MCRHDRGPRVLAPELLVLSPDPVDDPPPDWLRDLRGTEAVYRDPALLWRSARHLFVAGAIELPGGLRSLIEPVYAADAPVPSGLAAKSDMAQAARISAGQLGLFNVLRLTDGYCRTQVRGPTICTPRPGWTMIVSACASRASTTVHCGPGPVISTRTWPGCAQSLHQSKALECQPARLNRPWAPRLRSFAPDGQSISVMCRFWRWRRLGKAGGWRMRSLSLAGLDYCSRILEDQG